ncbi:hypothetical protein QR680_001018 [Steinernema hermaphroditum]|uniref:Amino acid permease/ SLC12A domain-containing protein n=1 Tax=Steinernema hermaphroditum TaxID=289476 RepID=A0AA39GZG9_9BILA|nr:hypothetical protein QR680_001018 [Steinernema hermaphroditum]
MPMSRLWRTKAANDEFLFHSEWTRKIGPLNMIGVAGVISIPLGVFYIIPYAIAHFSGPSTVLAIIAAFVVAVIASLQQVELSCAAPKNCVLYQMSYLRLGELPAFLVGWMTLFDGVALISTIHKVFSNYVNLLFRGVVDRHLRFPVDHLGLLPLAAIEEKYDALAAIGILCSMLILTCSLRVVSVLSVILLTVSSLIIFSCIVVCVFYADPENWVQQGFFKNGLDGLVDGTSTVLVAFAGIEALSHLVEETHKPLSRVPVLLPLIVTIISMFLFISTTIFTLAVDFSKLPTDFLLPEIFNNVRIPSARYVLSVGSVCGLAGTSLGIILPISRLLCSMASDRLVPLLFLSKLSRKGIPCRSVLVICALSCAFVFLNADFLMPLIRFNASFRLLISTFLVFVQRFHPTAIGLEKQTSKYRSFGKRLRVSWDDGLSTTNSFTNGEVSFSSSTNLYNMLCKMESDRFEHSLQKSSEINESSALMFGQKLPADEGTAKRNSRIVVRHFPIDPKANPPHIHNCIGSPCSEDDGDPDRFHLYQRDEPELAYFAEYDSNTPSGSDSSDKPTTYRNVVRLFWMFTAFSVTFGLCTRERIIKNQLASIVISAVLLTVILVIVFTFLRFKPNRHLSRPTPVFPFLSFLALFVVCSSLSSLHVIDYAKVSTVVMTGLLVYFSYGFRQQKPAGLTIYNAANAKPEDDDIAESAAIMEYKPDSFLE